MGLGFLEFVGKTLVLFLENKRNLLAVLCIHVLERREFFELFGIVLIRKLIRLSCVPKSESSVMSNLYFYIL